VELAPAEAGWVPVAVQLPDETAANLKPGAHPIEFEITLQASPGEAGPVVAEHSTFVVPR
jgi:hypothetical protein